MISASSILLLVSYLQNYVPTVEMKLSHTMVIVSVFAPVELMDTSTRMEVKDAELVAANWDKSCIMEDV